jgi:hypothetical protein
LNKRKKLCIIVLYSLIILYFMPTTEFHPLRKMTTHLNDQGVAQYQLETSAGMVLMNDLIGQPLTLLFNGHIACQHCGRKTKKSYSQGFCFPCMQKLAQCDMCIMKPEQCHYSAGTCREPEWGEQHCMVDHYVYLANTSGLKVGITRYTQLPTRWIDQGATQALPIFKVTTRLLSGLVETALTAFIADKTNWRVMLKGGVEDINLIELAETLKPKISTKLDEIRLQLGENSITELAENITSIEYPVLEFPSKISSHNFDKSTIVSGILLGIKGQYLIFDSGVINIRKFTSYYISLDYN